MPKVAYRQIRTRGVFLDQPAFRREVERTIEEKSKPELIAAHDRIVANWQNQPEFRARKRITQRGITLFVFSSGDNADIWRYVTGGTRPHPILPKRARALRFKWNGPGSYRPKTNTRGQFGGPGVSTGPVRFFKRVMHPGNAPRRFERIIAIAYKPTFSRDIENAMRRGLRRARRR